MPDEVGVGQAAFTEVLDLSINTQGFADQMDQIVAIYTSALEKMPSIGELGGGSALSESVDKLNEVLQRMAAGAGEALGDLANHMTETSEGMQSAFAQTAASIQESQAKIVEAVKGGSQAIRQARSDASEPTRGKQDTSFNVQPVENAQTSVASNSEYSDLNSQQKSAQQKRDFQEFQENSKAEADLEKEQQAELLEISKTFSDQKAIQQKREYEEYVANSRAELDFQKEQQAELVELNQAFSEQKVLQQKRDYEEYLANTRAEVEAEKVKQAEINELQKESSTQKAIQQKRDLEDYLAAGRAELEAEKTKQAEINALNEETSRQKSIQQKRDLEEYLANAAEESRVKQIQQNRDIQEYEARSKAGSGSALTDFFSGFADNFVKSAGGIAKAILIFDSINLAIEGTTAAIQAPFKAIAEGFTYLENVQNRASEVKAALLQSVSYSGDYGQNLAIAGQQADGLIRKIDDLAVKLNVKSQTIQSGFSSFLEAGGRNLTSSTDEALQVSGLITGALQSQTPNLDSRKILSEMQKLVQGTAGDSDKLAIALGLSKDQMSQLVVHAQKYHDLYQELLVLAPGITDRIADANERQTTLVETLDLYKERFEALVAGPIFARFIDLLKQAVKYTDDNQEKFEAIGVALGKVVDLAAQFIEEFAKANFATAVGAFQGMALFALSVATSIADIVNGLTAVVRLGNNAKNFVSESFDIDNTRAQTLGKKDDVDKQVKSGRISQAQGDQQKQQLDKEYSATVDQIKNRGESLTKILTDTFSTAKNEYSAAGKLAGLVLDPNKKTNHQTGFQGENQDLLNAVSGDGKLYDGGEAPNTPTHGINTKAAAPKYSEDTLHDDNQKLEDELTVLKNKYQETYATIDDEVKKGALSHKEASQQIVVAASQEYEAQKRLIEAYKTKVQSSGAKPSAINSALNSANKQEDTLKGQENAKISSGFKASDAEDEQVAKIHYNTMLALQDKFYKDWLASIKKGVEEGRLTQLQGFDQESAEQNAAYLNKRGTLEDGISKNQHNPVEQATLYKQLGELEQQYTDTVRDRSNERVEITRQENQQRFQISQRKLGDNVQIHETIDSASLPNASEQITNQQEILRYQTAITDANIANTASLLENARAKNANSEATLSLEEQLRKEQSTRLQQFGSAIKQSVDQVGNNPGLRQVTASNTASSEIAKVQAQLSQLVAALTTLQNDAKDKYAQGDAPGLAQNGQAQQALQAKIVSTSQSLANMEQVSDNLGLSFGKAAQSLEDSLLGPGFNDKITNLVTAFQSATDSTEKLTDGFGVAATALQGLDNLGKSITGAIAQYSQGQKQGGALGGVGSLLSSGPVSDALSAIPVVGSIVKPLGDAFSFIGDLFVDQAKKIAAQVGKSITAINAAYSAGTATLSQTIAALQAQRDAAVSQLSGKKGGQAQLDSLLPNIDSEIASLQLQAENTKKSFEDIVLQMSSGNTELQSWTTTWMGINKQVADYLAAGGDIATANEYLNEQLKAQQVTLTDSLNSGEQTAIQDAINLNNLLQQRVDLVKQEAQTEFGIENQNAIEKRTSTGVQVASQLANQRQGYNEQLNDLDYQISTTQQKVALESQIFGIASDTATLEAQSNALTLYALQEQLAVYKEQATLLQSISSLTFSGSSFNPIVPGTGVSGTSAISGVTSLTVNVNAGSQDVNSQQFSTYLATAIQSMVVSNRTNI